MPENRRTQIVRGFENRVLRRKFGSKREEVEGDWRRLHNEELHNLYASPIIVRVIKSRRMRYVARMRDDKCTQYFSRKT
jgi:hypothetical protein